ncbi:hypothetical protein Y032_0152g2881 [Ancylostoma ceylanicum]|uniref:Uncharacterized protein n=1 Tax=Ancylostoma ceylanicum TaxID=53326 RepID=A0A016T0I9_9BILA|nr:hypothetical protein Y032_0152g2881 [Ancylostoma ceylanicum]
MFSVNCFYSCNGLTKPSIIMEGVTHPPRQRQRTQNKVNITRAANGDSSETAFQPGSFMDIDDDVEDPRKNSNSSFFTANQGSQSILNMKI